MKIHRLMVTSRAAAESSCYNIKLNLTCMDIDMIEGACDYLALKVPTDSTVWCLHDQSGPFVVVAWKKKDTLANTGFIVLSLCTDQTTSCRTQACSLTT